MKKLVKFGVVSSLLVSSVVFAFNPVDGFYVGILAGVSRGPGSENAVFEYPGSNQLLTGRVDYDVVGGGGGAVLGYKLKHFRLEGEVLYNRISTGPFKMDGCTIQNVNIFSPTGYTVSACTEPQYREALARGLAYSGSSSATYAIANLYFNIFADNEHQTVPYLGVGVGGVRINNNNNLQYNRQLLPLPASQKMNTSANGMAYQGIVGVSYYMDDLTWVGMDYRFTGTGRMTALGNRSYSLNAIMFNVNFAFDKGAIDC